MSIGMTTMKKLIILGAGGYGQTVADIAEQLGYATAFLDDNSPLALGACGEFMRFMDAEVLFYPAFGNNERRVEWLVMLAKSGCPVATLTHPTAYVSPKATIGTGTIILPGAIVNTGCVVRQGCIVNCGAIVDHGCTLEEGVHVCLGAVVKAENHLPRCMKVEAGQVIGNREYQ